MNIIIEEIEHLGEPDRVKQLQREVYPKTFK